MLRQALAEHQAVFADLQKLCGDIERIGGVLSESLRARGKLLFCGNGGSAADSQHLAAELTGRFVNDREPLSAIALSTDTSALTCIGNDYGFQHVFERQVRAIGRRGDVLIGISTSGNSGNVLLAVDAARVLGITTVGLLGKDGGELVSRCDYSIVVPSYVTARIQEAHIFIGHCWCSQIEAELGFHSV